jgi:bla regulator protein BlaR1
MNNYLASFGPGLANHLWQSTAFAAAAWFATIFLRKHSARVRYGLWLAASIKFLVPFSLLIAAGGLLPKPKQFVAPAMYTAMQVTEQPFADLSSTSVTSLAQTLTLTRRITADIPAVLLTLWFAGVTVVLIVWWMRWRKASMCLHNAVTTDSGREREILHRLEARISGPPDSPLRLKLSAEKIEPSVYGIFRPVLVWPQHLSERLSDEHIEAIMTHELAHARRFDNAAAALHMLVESIFWLHPMVWWMERRMIDERERACDEAVVASGGNPDAYAEGILETCRFCVLSDLPCIAGVTGADLRKRVVGIMTSRMLAPMTWPKKMALGVVALWVLAAPVLLGQLQTPPAFEVASVRKHPPDPSARMISTGSPAGDVSQWVRTNVTAEWLIVSAYGVKDFQIVGGPSWINSEHFDVDAKVDDSAAAQLENLPVQQRVQQMALMLRPLLADRFKLQITRGTKEGTVLALVVVKGGPKLKEVPAPDPHAPLQPVPPITPENLPTPPPGQSFFVMGNGHATLSANALPIARLVDQLSRVLGQQVVDQTGLGGTYQWTLQYAPPPGTPGGMPLSVGAEASSNPDLTSIFTALQEQLGLKLESTKGQIDTITIDHIEEPTPN